MRSSLAKKARLFRTWCGGHPIWCAWQVTYRCNFRCRFCGYWHDPLGAKPEPTVADYIHGARKLAGFGTMLVSLAGGEPFLRTDLPDIVAAVGEYHLPFVTTNGWLVDQAAAEAVMSAGLWGVSISIDYADPALHDSARGMAGAWQQAWRAVELFSAARKHKFQRVNVMAVLMDDNIDHLEELMKMAAEREAYFMVQPYGYKKINSRKYECTDNNIGDLLIEMKDRNPNFLSNRTFLQKFDAFRNGGIPDCRAGRAFYNIDSAGDIAICVENKHQPIANLFSDNRYVISRRLREASKNNSCTCCWYNCRGEVESLYKPKSLLQSLPTLFRDQGRAIAARRRGKS